MNTDCRRFSKLLAFVLVSSFILHPSSLPAGEGFVRFQSGQATRDATGQAARLKTTTAGSGEERVDTLVVDGGAGGGSGGDASAANQQTQITAEQAILATAGAKSDAKSTATDTTPISIVSILKQISASVQAPPSQAVTGPVTDAQLRATAVPTSVQIAKGATNYANGQVTASSSAATLVASRATRRSVLVRNLDASLDVYVGNATVTSGNGMLLKAGESFPIDAVGLIQVIAPSGSPVVAYMETYD